MGGSRLGGHHIRHYGLLASGNRTANIARARQLLGAAPRIVEHEQQKAPASVSSGVKLLEKRRFEIAQRIFSDFGWAVVHPERIKCTAVLTTAKVDLEAFVLAGRYGVPADLDGVCARRPRRSAVGAEEGPAARSNKGR